MGKCSFVLIIATSPKGVLKNSDRTTLEIATTLLNDFRQDRASFNTSRLNALQKPWRLLEEPKSIVDGLLRPNPKRTQMTHGRS